MFPAAFLSAHSKSQSRAHSYRSIGALLSLGLLIGCSDIDAKNLSAPHIASPAKNAVCQIHYSTIPAFGGGALSSQQRQAADAVATSIEKKSAFLKSQNQLVQNLTNELLESEVISAEALQLVVGGYKGYSSRSIALSLPWDSDSTEQDIAVLNAVLAYVFIQESVFSHCPATPDDTNIVQALSFVEEPNIDLLTSASATEIYKMMIDVAGAPDDVGFTYYPTEDRFFSLEFHNNPIDETQIMETVLDLLRQDLKDPSQLSLVKSDRTTQFTYNDWTDSPNGAEHLAVIGDRVPKAKLDEWRAKFLDHLERFAAQA